MATLPAYAQATGSGRAADMAKLDNQILMARLIQSGAYVDKNGQLVGSPAQLQKELDKQNRLNELEDKRRGLLDPGLAPEPDEEDTGDGEVAPGSIGRTVRQGWRRAALGMRVAGATTRHLGRRWNQRLARVPTPGGMWVPIVLLLVLWLAIIPENGHTRLRWLWMVYMGDAQVTVSDQTKNTGPPSFGPTQQPPPLPPTRTTLSAPTQIGSAIQADTQQLTTLQDLFGNNTMSFLSLMNGAYSE